MVEAKIQEEERCRTWRANEIIQLIIGQRAKKPSLQKIHQSLLGKRQKKTLDLSPGLQRVLAQSHKRVRDAKAQKEREQQNDGEE